MLGRKWHTEKLSIKLLLMLALGLRNFEDLKTSKEIRNEMLKVDRSKGTPTKKGERTLM
jgi:hypothetical protein